MEEKERDRKERLKWCTEKIIEIEKHIQNLKRLSKQEPYEKMYLKWIQIANEHKKIWVERKTIDLEL